MIYKHETSRPAKPDLFFPPYLQIIEHKERGRETLAFVSPDRHLTSLTVTVKETKKIKELVTSSRRDAIGWRDSEETLLLGMLSVPVEVF